MTYFDKPLLDLADTRIVAVFTAYNEAERIPFFLSYYRTLGVQHFLAIDNNSTDRTARLLREQPDVTYFHTRSSYVESQAGRLWTSELANHYCVDKWCLTLDLDEQLVFPASEFAGLWLLCDYLEEQGSDALFTTFLDMYANRPLSQAIYKPGQPYLHVCDHFDADGYGVGPAENFPPTAVFGGPRQRMFWDEGKRGRGPSMRKLPLVRWRRGFEYIHSTHSCSPVQLADITGATLHFKFFSSFKSLAEREHARGDRVQSDHYALYSRLTREQDVNFLSPRSKRYIDTSTLVEEGIAVCSRRYLERLRPYLVESMGPGPARKVDGRYRGAMQRAEANAAVSLKHLPAIWSLLAAGRGRQKQRATPILSAARGAVGAVLSVRDDRVYGWAYDPNLPLGVPLEVQAVRGEKAVTVKTGLGLPEDSGAPEYAATCGFEIRLPPPTDALSDEPIRIAAGDALVAAAVRPRRTMADAGLRGYCEPASDGVVRGWVFRPDAPHAHTAVAIFVDGRFLARIEANGFRNDLRLAGIARGDHGFAWTVPARFRDGRRRLVEVFAADSGAPLTRSPLWLEGLVLTPRTNARRRLARWLRPLRRRLTRSAAATADAS